MKVLRVTVALPALLLVLGYVWVRSAPYRAKRRARAAVRLLAAWAKAIGKALTQLRWERPKPVSGERKSWFIWCSNCHKRFGMAVQKGGMIELRIGPKQNTFTVDEATAAQLSLRCHYCGKPVSILTPIGKGV
jgi:cytochrome c553